MSGWYQLGVVKFKSKKTKQKNTDTHFQQNTLGGGCKKLLTKLEEEEVSRQAVNSSSREKSEKVKKFLDCQNFCSDRHAHTHTKPC